MGKVLTAPRSCWVLSDGRRGIENQALGLAEALARLIPLQINLRHVGKDGLIQAAMLYLQLVFKSTPANFGFTEPFPDIAIGCGRQAILPLRALKKQCGSNVFTIYVQDPHMSPRYFDLVIAPEHDGIKGPNVIQMTGSPNRIVQEQISSDTLTFSHTLATVPAPRIVMLIGGDSQTHTLDEDVHEAHMRAAHAVLDQKLSLLISTSRRTPEFVIKAYRELEKTRECVWFYDGKGRNPYFAFLGSATAILVTEDSTNMLTEACATGKPVFTLPMQGSPGKFVTLYDRLREHCNVVPFTGVFDAPDYSPLKETDRVAKTVAEKLGDVK